MSWKIYLIVITNASNVNPSDVPQKIGLTDLKPRKEISIQEAQSINGISIGKYNDKIFIVSRSIISKFYDPTPSDFERKICDSFPNSDIAILALDGTVDLFGYNIIKNGKRQRVKAGADLDIFVDYGEKIEEEVALSKEKIFDDSELDEIKKNNTPETASKIIDQEIGIRTTFRLTRRYFGKEVDEPGSDYEKIRVTAYE